MIALKRDIVLFESQILHIDAYTYSYIYKHIYYYRKLAAIIAMSVSDYAASKKLYM